MDNTQTDVAVEDKTGFLTRDQIFSQVDLVIEKVTLPAPYKGFVFVKGMDGLAYDEYQDSILIKGKDGQRTVDLKKSKAKLLVQCICDESGKLMFTEADIPLLCTKSNKFLEGLTKVAQRLNGMGEEAKEKN